MSLSQSLKSEFENASKLGFEIETQVETGTRIEAARFEIAEFETAEFETAEFEIGTEQIES